LTKYRNQFDTEDNDWDNDGILNNVDDDMDGKGLVLGKMKRGPASPGVSILAFRWVSPPLPTVSAPPRAGDGIPNALDTK
jgi:hypothetical protein